VLTTYPRRRSASASPLSIGIGIVLFIVIVFAGLQLVRGAPAPAVTVTLAESSVLGEPRTPALPSDGQGIVSVVGLGTLGVSGPDTPQPIASVTKMMTAYVILKDKPLQMGQTGPQIAITARDADRYWEMVAEDQSVAPVTQGQSFSQLQLLQGLLIPSANNFGEILAIWDAGSVPAFVEKMNAEAQALGMTNTRYVDVSGFSSRSVSTAQDQLILARTAMENPVFASIVGTKTLRLPGSGEVSNINQLLGSNGIIGIKTGFTEDAGGNLAFAARREAAGRQVDVIGVVLGQEDRPAAFDATLDIINSLNNGLQVAHVVPAGQPVGTYKPAWTGAIDIVVPEDVIMLVWPGMRLETSIELLSETGESVSNAYENHIGWLNVRVGEQEHKVPLVLTRDPGSAGVLWKLTRF
jgi:serine-type D-Ala-D-Ala carboxypeptidase (penicillin-binding protein 5/6)